MRSTMADCRTRNQPVPGAKKGRPARGGPFLFHCGYGCSGVFLARLAALAGTFRPGLVAGHEAFKLFLVLGAA